MRDSTDPVAFFVRLDWDNDLGAWRCPALQIVTASVKSLRSNQKQIPAEEYTVEQSTQMIFWSRNHWENKEEPPSVAACIEVSSALMEPKKKIPAALITAVRAVIVAIISGLTTYKVAIAGNQAKGVGCPDPGCPKAAPCPENVVECTVLQSVHPTLGRLGQSLNVRDVEGAKSYFNAVSNMVEEAARRCPP
jgi:hypothetical protein